MYTAYPQPACCQATLRRYYKRFIRILQAGFTSNSLHVRQVYKRGVFLKRQPARVFRKRKALAGILVWQKLKGFKVRGVIQARIPAPRALYLLRKAARRKTPLAAKNTSPSGVISCIRFLQEPALCPALFCYRF